MIFLGNATIFENVGDSGNKIVRSKIAEITSWISPGIGSCKNQSNSRDSSKNALKTAPQIF